MPRCHKPWQEMIIDADGTVNPCCYWSAYGNHNETLGNVNDASVADIWNNEGFRNLRANMARGDLAAAGCANCFALKQGYDLGLLYDKDADDAPEDDAYARNIRTLKAEVAAGAAELTARPTMVAIAPSHHCHLRCLHCSQEPTRTLALDSDEPVDQVLALSDVLVRLNAVGGEPFILPVWRRFLDRYERAENPYLCFSTCTSASLLPAGVLDNLRKFKTVNINVSVDGTAGVYEKVRVNAKWDDVVANIAKLKAIVADKPGSAIGLSMSVMRTNLRDLPNFIRFAANQRLLFSIIPVTIPLTQSLASFSSIYFDTDGWREAFAEARDVVEAYWLPKYMGDHPYGDAELQHWRNAIDIVEAAVPWQLMDRRHFRVTVTIPKAEVASLLGADALAAYAKSPRTPHRVVHLFPAGETWNVPPYHAPLVQTEDGGFRFTADLPGGRFEARVGDKWQADRSDWFSLLVPEGRRVGEPLVGVWSRGSWRYAWSAVRVARAVLRPQRGKTGEKPRVLAPIPPT